MTQVSEPGFKPTAACPPVKPPASEVSTQRRARSQERSLRRGPGGGAEPASARRLRDGAAAGKRNIHQAADPGAPALCGV